MKWSLHGILGARMMEGMKSNQHQTHYDGRTGWRRTKNAKRPMKLNEYVKAAKSANEYLSASQYRQAEWNELSGEWLRASVRPSHIELHWATDRIVNSFQVSIWIKSKFGCPLRQPGWMGPVWLFDDATCNRKNIPQSHTHVKACLVIVCVRRKRRIPMPLKFSSSRLKHIMYSMRSCFLWLSSIIRSYLIFTKINSLRAWRKWMDMYCNKIYAFCVCANWCIRGLVPVRVMEKARALLLRAHRQRAHTESMAIWMRWIEIGELAGNMRSSWERQHIRVQCACASRATQAEKKYAAGNVP